jgi:hypothetical protein
LKAYQYFWYCWMLNEQESNLCDCITMSMKVCVEIWKPVYEETEAKCSLKLNSSIRMKVLQMLIIPLIARQ